MCNDGNHIAMFITYTSLALIALLETCSGYANECNIIGIR